MTVPIICYNCHKMSTFFEPLLTEISDDDVCFDASTFAGTGSFAQLIGKVRLLSSEKYLLTFNFSLVIVAMMSTFAMTSTFSCVLPQPKLQLAPCKCCLF